MRALHMKRGEGRSIPQYTNSTYVYIPPTPFVGCIIKGAYKCKIYAFDYLY